MNDLEALFLIRKATGKYIRRHKNEINPSEVLWEIEDILKRFKAQNKPEYKTEKPLEELHKLIQEF